MATIQGKNKKINSGLMQLLHDSLATYSIEDQDFLQSHERLSEELHEVELEDVAFEGDWNKEENVQFAFDDLADTASSDSESESTDSNEPCTDASSDLVIELLFFMTKFAINQRAMEFCLAMWAKRSFKVPLTVKTLSKHCKKVIQVSDSDGNLTETLSSACKLRYDKHYTVLHILEAFRRYKSGRERDRLRPLSHITTDVEFSDIGGSQRDPPASPTHQLAVSATPSLPTVQLPPMSACSDLDTGKGMRLSANQRRSSAATADGIGFQTDSFAPTLNRSSASYAVGMRSQQNSPAATNLLRSAAATADGIGSLFDSPGSRPPAAGPLRERNGAFGRDFTPYLDFLATRGLSHASTEGLAHLVMLGLTEVAKMKSEMVQGLSEVRRAAASSRHFNNVEPALSREELGLPLCNRQQYNDFEVKLVDKYFQQGAVEFLRRIGGRTPDVAISRMTDSLLDTAFQTFFNATGKDYSAVGRPITGDKISFIPVLLPLIVKAMSNVPDMTEDAIRQRVSRHIKDARSRLQNKEKTISQEQSAGRAVASSRPFVISDSSGDDDEGASVRPKHKQRRLT